MRAEVKTEQTPRKAGRDPTHRVPERSIVVPTIVVCKGQSLSRCLEVPVDVYRRSWRWRSVGASETSIMQYVKAGHVVAERRKQALHSNGHLGRLAVLAQRHVIGFSV